MADPEQTDDSVLQGIRSIADDDAAPHATRLRALELLAKIGGLFRERQGPQYVTIIRHTPPLRLPADQPEDQEADDEHRDA